MIVAVIVRGLLRLALDVRRWTLPAFLLVYIAPVAAGELPS
jgi:hypothetical protein